VTLFSKCVAGGFSAGVVLLWWPLLVPGDSLTAWLSRGVAFTFTFELLLLGLRPLEHALWATRSGTRLRARIDGVASRLSAGDTVRRLGSTAALAAVAVSIPAALIATGLHERPDEDDKQAASAPRVVRITKVVRPVKVKRVIDAPAPAVPVTPPSQPAPPTRTEPKPARRTPAAEPRKGDVPAKRKNGTAEEPAATPKAQTEEPPAEMPERPASGSSTGTQPQLG
jgi:hypothetical protein